MTDPAVEVIAKALETRAADFLAVTIQAAGRNEELRQAGTPVEVKDRQIVAKLAEVDQLQRTAAGLRDGSVQLAEVGLKSPGLAEPAKPNGNGRRRRAPAKAATPAAPEE